MQDRSPEDLLGPVKSGSMLFLKFRFDFISMERSWRTLQSRCDMLMRGREGPSSRCWKRKMGDTAEILQGGCCVLVFCWQESHLWVYRLQQHPRRVGGGHETSLRGLMKSLSMLLLWFTPSFPMTVVMRKNLPPSQDMVGL